MTTKYITDEFLNLFSQREYDQLRSECMNHGWSMSEVMHLANKEQSLSLSHC